MPINGYKREINQINQGKKEESKRNTVNAYSDSNGAESSEDT